MYWWFTNVYRKKAKEKAYSYYRLYWDIYSSECLHNIVYDFKKDIHFNLITRLAVRWYQDRNKRFLNIAKAIADFTKRVKLLPDTKKHEQKTNKTSRDKRAKPRKLRRIRKTGKKAVFVPISLSIAPKVKRELENAEHNIYSYMVKAFNGDVRNLGYWCSRNGHSMKIFPKFIKYKAITNKDGSFRLVYEPHIQGVMFADCMAVVNKLEALWCDGENHKMGYKRNNKGKPCNFWVGDFWAYENPFYGWVGGDFDEESHTINAGYLNTSHNVGSWSRGKIGGYGRSILEKVSMFDIWDLFKRGNNFFGTWASGLMAYP